MSLLLILGLTVAIVVLEFLALTGPAEKPAQGRGGAIG
jgi:hypothetical protein